MMSKSLIAAVITVPDGGPIMGKGSSRVEAWHLVLIILCVTLGVFLGLRLHEEMIRNGIRPAMLAIESLLVITFSIVTWFITYHYFKYQSIKRQKDLARTSIRKTFELLKTTSRTLDNIDAKAATILNSNNSNTLDKSLAHEFVQGIRVQVIEIYNNVSTCIEEWRDTLLEEFDQIEKKERQIDKLIIDQIVKTRRLHELEKKGDANENEVSSLRAELDRLAEKQQVSRANILSESRKLVGAPITTIMDITRASYSLGKFEPVLKQPVYLNDNNNDAAQ